MAKYTPEIKKKAVEMAKAGVHLKQIQADIGPNPKAVERYLKKEGTTYAKVLADLKARNIVPKTPLGAAKAKAKEKADTKMADKIAATAQKKTN